jgi:hypothetical protein
LGTTDIEGCASGPACKTPDSPLRGPLCADCLDGAGRDIRGLPYDYLDLAQLQEPALSQAVTETTGGSRDAPMPLSGHVEALQAEIVHALSTWEYELRVVARLSNPNTFAPVWRTAVYDGIDFARRNPATFKARGGSIVQRAAGIITPRLELLASLPETLVCPAGVEDEPVPMYGWEAVHQLQDLHGRARGVLGRTTRRFWIPGECWHCPARPVPEVDGPLWRSEPTRFDDEMQVNCSKCDATRPYPDYETYLLTLLWPDPIAA